MFTRRWLCGTVVLLVAVLVAAPRAGAEPVAWDYTGQVVTTGPNFTTLPGAGPPDTHLLYGQQRLPSGGSITYPDDQVQFANVAGSASGSQSVTAFQMRASTDFGGGPFSSSIHTFTLGFGITDRASGASGTLTFQGNLSGNMTSSSFIGGSVFLQVGFTGAKQQSLVLGNHLYTVTVSPFDFPRYGESLPGPLPFVSPYANVPVSVQVTDVPEPGTLALAASGLAGLGLHSWRRRRTRRAVT